MRITRLSRGLALTLAAAWLGAGAGWAGILDSDGDGLSDGDEQITYGTDPFLADTDGDGLDDGDEVLVHGTDPLADADADGDTIRDAAEVAQGTSPHSTDTDQDGVSDPTDNCPSAYNPDQADSGTLGGPAGDGVGDLCQNADFDRSGDVGALDVVLVRRRLAGLEPELNLSMPPRVATEPCGSDPNLDDDGDGFSELAGDCDDCNAQVNPNAVELANFFDDDCDALVDEPASVCDAGLAIAGVASEAAQAIGLCKSSSGPGDWGVVSALWVSPDGGPAPFGANFHLGHGLLADFGPNVPPLEGTRLLALSSGTARDASDPGYIAPSNAPGVGGFDKGITSSYPSGFPLGSPSCPTPGTPHDPAALQLVLRVPANATAFEFRFAYYSADFPDGLCQAYADSFVALVSPAPPGSVSGNVAFNGEGNPIGGVFGGFNACGTPIAGQPCNLGGTTLAGTGYEQHAAIAWLTSTVPVTPGSEIALRFVIVDGSDGLQDSTVLIDGFRWLALP